MFSRFYGEESSGNIPPQLHQGTLDLGEGGDIPDIERILNYIEGNVWQWAI